MQYYSMLKDGIDGSLSSRRVITVLAFILCAIAFIANLFFGLSMEKFIFDSMSYIAMAGLGATVAEKFSGAEKIKAEQQYFDRANRYPQQYNTYTPPTPYNTMRGRRLPEQEDPLL